MGRKEGVSKCKSAQIIRVGRVRITEWGVEGMSEV